jgi:hypothetical protein
MKTPTLFVTLITALCFLGCSKEGGSTGKAKGIVPATAAEIAALPEFKLEHTTKSGVKCYVRQITPEVARTITEESPDHRFLEDREPPYLLVIVYNDKIIDLTADDPGLTTEQGFEVAAWSIKKTLSEDKEMQEMLKKAGKQ